LRTLLKSVLKPILKVLYKYYMRPGRQVKIDGLKFKVESGVFHPGFFFSSKILKNQLLTLDLQGKTVLDIGSGSGILSIFAASKQAKATAIDISEQAVKATKENAALNGLQIEVICSNLWKNLPEKQFDIIVVNPPYYPQNPAAEAQHAWYCGENFEYFSRFYAGLRTYLHQKSVVLMVLSEDCDIEQISRLATQARFALHERLSRKNLWETNFIFEIRRSEDH